MLAKKIKRAAAKNQSDTQSQCDPKAKQLKQSNGKSSQLVPAGTASPFFDGMKFWQKIYDIECRLSAELKIHSFLSTAISAVYNPIEYAADLHCNYLKKFLNAPKPVVFIGMNPGPFGMVQTGVKKNNHSHLLYLETEHFYRSN